MKIPDGIPIVFDLDGTLILDEISYLSFKKFIYAYPLSFWKILLWLPRGMAFVKQQLALRVEIDPATLTYNKCVIDFIDQHKGRRMILATGADQKYADIVAEYLKCFENVIASDGQINSISHVKAERLNILYGYQGYIYVGNSAQDLTVWSESAFAIATNVPNKVLETLKKLPVPFGVLK